MLVGRVANVAGVAVAEGVKRAAQDGHGRLQLLVAHGGQLHEGMLIAGGDGTGHAVGGDGDVDFHALVGIAGQGAADAE